MTAEAPNPWGVFVTPYVGSVDEFAERERECWEHWGSLTETQNDQMVRTVETEMQRLTGSVASWLPAAARRSNGFVDILIRLQVDEVGDVISSPLSVQERLDELVVIEDLKRLMEEE